MPTPPLGNPNQIDASDIDIDLPMGKPPGAAEGGSLEEGTVEDEEDEEEIGNEFKQLVTKLVRQGKLISLLCFSLLCTSCALIDIDCRPLQISLTLIPSSSSIIYSNAK